MSPTTQIKEQNKLVARSELQKLYKSKLTKPQFLVHAQYIVSVLPNDEQL